MFKKATPQDTKGIPLAIGHLTGWKLWNGQPVTRCEPDRIGVEGYSYRAGGIWGWAEDTEALKTMIANIRRDHITPEILDWLIDSMPARKQ